jgi:hypothetical protein
MFELLRPLGVLDLEGQLEGNSAGDLICLQAYYLSPHTFEMICKNWGNMEVFPFSLAVFWRVASTMWMLDSCPAFSANEE